MDFRDCTRADDPKDRYHARLLAWWIVLTEGMSSAKLEIAKAVKQIEDVKHLRQGWYRWDGRKR